MKKEFVFSILICFSSSVLADEDARNVMRPPPMSAPALSVGEAYGVNTGSSPGNFVDADERLILKNRELMDLVQKQEAMIMLLEERIRSLEGGVR